MDAVLSRAVLGQARQRDACRTARRGAIVRELADRDAADISVRLRERQMTVAPQLVGPELHLNQEDAATAASKPVEHLQASALREFPRVRRYLHLQRVEQRPAALLLERLRELAEVRVATLGALQDAFLSADRPQAQNAMGRPAAVQV